MAILAFQKPEKVIMLESTSSFGKFEFRPLEPGFGTKNIWILSKQSKAGMMD